MIRTTILRQTLHSSFDRYRADLGTDITDEMAFPSYLQGSILSRYFFWRKLEYVIKAAELRPTTVVLDFGCGSGVLLPTLSGEERIVWATDLHLDPARYLAAALDLPSIRFIEPELWRQTIPDASLDRIVAANVLEHIDNRDSVLEVFAQKLKPDGRLMISGPTENLLYRVGRRLIGFSGNYHVSTIFNVLTDAQKSGFRMARQYKFPLFEPFCLYIIASFRVSNSERPIRVPAG